MPSKLIVIVGITGNQGASVADVFLQESGWKIRGISRDPSKASSKVWSDKGVEMIAADLNDLDRLKSAFKGANVVFGVTDSWQGMALPSTHEQAAKRGVTPNEVCYDMEVQQGRNMVDAAASTLDTLDRFVLSTLSNSHKWSKEAINFCLHFDAKWTAVDYMKRSHVNLYKKASLLQVALFASNWKTAPLMAPKKQSDGTYVVRIPMKPDSKIPMVEPRLDTGHFVKALVQVEPGKNLLGAASVLSWKEWCDLWGKIVGKTCRYEQADRKEIEDAMPGGVGRELADMFEYFSEYGYDGRDPSVIYPKDLGVDVPVTTIEEYIKQQDWSSVL